MAKFFQLFRYTLSQFVKYCMFMESAYLGLFCEARPLQSALESGRKITNPYKLRLEGSMWVWPAPSLFAFLKCESKLLLIKKFLLDLMQLGNFFPELVDKHGVESWMWSTLVKKKKYCVDKYGTFELWIPLHETILRCIIWYQSNISPLLHLVCFGIDND